MMKTDDMSPESFQKSRNYGHLSVATFAMLWQCVRRSGKTWKKVVYASSALQSELCLTSCYGIKDLLVELHKNLTAAQMSQFVMLNNQVQVLQNWHEYQNSILKNITESHQSALGFLELLQVCFWSTVALR
jgi:hypothetical protein